jgi:hypothetical protein
MSNLNFDNGVTMNLVNAVASAGTGSSFYSTTTTAGVINGEFVTTLGAQNNAASPTTDANTGVAFTALAPNQCCALVFGQNKAGTLKLVQGPIIGNLVGSSTTVGGMMVAPQFPALPEDFMPLCYTIVQTAPAAATWVPGNGTWTASGISASTFQNVAQLPRRPQIA